MPTTPTRRPLELLAPAKDVPTAIAAIDHGADAVYIGAERYGARAAASNGTDDIARLCSYAQTFGAKVYVTVNTIIRDEEMADTRQLFGRLKQAGVDAVLIQDMGLLDMQSILPLHASTQTDNRTATKVKWLRSLGFRRIVLARELSIGEITEIHQEVPDVELEAFVHGALCVSYSGLCYASQYCFGRSANRGECAQFCRLRFDLLDGEGNVIEHGRHLLSLKDMCRIELLEQLADAGVTSFKIEGRLKDMDYVKNVVAAYSTRLDDIVRRHPDRYERASHGRVRHTFKPDLRKTFNRGYTEYQFTGGRRRFTDDIFSPDTPKAMGECVGRVKELRHDSLNVAGTASFANGDGLCYLNDKRELEGFRVNRVEGNRLYPYHMPHDLRQGTTLYRNNDVRFSKMLAGHTAERLLPVRMTFDAIDNGFRLNMHTENGTTATSEIAFEHQVAQKPQRDNIVRQLAKLGGTPYVCDEVTGELDRYFVPSSLLTELRRDCCKTLMEADSAPDMETSHAQTCHIPQKKNIGGTTSYYSRFPYLYNIANEKARLFYANCGMPDAKPAFEISTPEDPPLLLMQCRHCLRYELGCCIRRGGTPPKWHEPLSLRMSDGRTFTLEFDCKNCQMNVLAASSQYQHPLASKHLTT